MDWVGLQGRVDALGGWIEGGSIVVFEYMDAMDAMDGFVGLGWIGDGSIVVCRLQGWMDLWGWLNTVV